MCNSFLILFTVVIVVIVLSLFILNKKEHFTSSSLYLAGPTKCFSCEREMIKRHGKAYAFMGKQSKCFSCERQLASVDPQLANYTHGTKCFSCERELDQNSQACFHCNKQRGNVGRPFDNNFNVYGLW